jgi:hypothetical protein
MTGERSLKRMLLRPGQRAERILFGLNRGVVMNLDLRDDLQRKLGIWEHEIAHFFKGRRDSIRSAIDVGASDGYYTLFFLKKTAAVRVFAFEPAEDARRQLALNLKANGLEGDPRLTLSPQSVGSRSDASVARLEAFKSCVATPCLVKVDVEGSEAEVLLGAGSLIDLPGVMWVIETHSLELERECQMLLSERGYTATVVPNAGWRFFVPELRPIPHNRWIVAERADVP